MNQEKILLKKKDQVTEADGAQGTSPDGAGNKTGTVPTDAMIIVPVRNMVLFPGMVVPITIGRKRSIASVQYALKGERQIGLLKQRNPDAETPTGEDLSTMGTVASILRYVTTADGSHHIICQGSERFRITGFLDGFPFIVAKIERVVEDLIVGDDDIEARFIQLRELALEVFQLLPQVPKELVDTVENIDSPGALADIVAGYLDIKAEEKQALLEEVDLRKRLDRLLELIF